MMRLLNYKVKNWYLIICSLITEMTRRLEKARKDTDKRGYGDVKRKVGNRRGEGHVKMKQRFK